MDFTVHHEDSKPVEKAGVVPKTAVGTIDYVAATLTAWNQCPTIVKKQLDQQFMEIKQLKEDLKAATLKLNQRKSDFDRQAAVEVKVELMKHKDKMDLSYRQKLEDEKKALMKQKVEEMDMILQENFQLKKELVNLKKDNKKMFK
jgi:hypothetical protein